MMYHYGYPETLLSVDVVLRVALGVGSNTISIHGSTRGKPVNLHWSRSALHHIDVYSLPFSAAIAPEEYASISTPIYGDTSHGADYLQRAFGTNMNTGISKAHKSREPP